MFSCNTRTHDTWTLILWRMYVDGIDNRSYSQICCISCAQGNRSADANKQTLRSRSRAAKQTSRVQSTLHSSHVVSFREVRKPSVLTSNLSDCYKTTINLFLKQQQQWKTSPAHNCSNVIALQHRESTVNSVDHWTEQPGYGTGRAEDTQELLRAHPYLRLQIYMKFFPCRKYGKSQRNFCWILTLKRRKAGNILNPVLL